MIFKNDLEKNFFKKKIAKLGISFYLTFINFFLINLNKVILKNL